MRINVDSERPENENYKIAFEEYKLLLAWTNSLAERRQETNNLFFGVTGAILSVVLLALTQLNNPDRVFSIAVAASVGIIVSAIWASLLQRYREVLRFKYTQLELFETVLGLDKSGLVTAENDYFRLGKPLEISGQALDLEPPSRIGMFGITVAERTLPLLLCGVFLVIVFALIVDYF